MIITCQKKHCINHNGEKCERDKISLGAEGNCLNYSPEYQKPLTQCEQAIVSAVATELNKFRKTGYSFESFDIDVQLENVSGVGGPETIVTGINIKTKILT